MAGTSILLGAAFTWLAVSAPVQARQPHTSSPPSEINRSGVEDTRNAPSAGEEHRPASADRDRDPQGNDRRRTVDRPSGEGWSRELAHSTWSAALLYIAFVGIIATVVGLAAKRYLGRTHGDLS